MHRCYSRNLQQDTVNKKHQLQNHAKYPASATAEQICPQVMDEMLSASNNQLTLIIVDTVH